MPPAVAKAPARKRNRKRKRRAASSSSSESSTSSGSESDDENLNKPTNTTTLPAKAAVQAQSSDSSDSSSESSSGSDSEPEEGFIASPVVTSGNPPPKPAETRHRSPSPSPPPTKLPTFLPETNKGEKDTIAQERLMKEKFRKFWMASIADGFRDDLEEIRKVFYAFHVAVTMPFNACSMLGTKSGSFAPFATN